jgi:hypothetical protein
VKSKLSGHPGPALPRSLMADLGDLGREYSGHWSHPPPSLAVASCALFLRHLALLI